ncbi:hypothetical protein EU803_00670 [Loktanella sp. IMCC34160]|uniref:hypothetical protein n=1 Tax=Loktanella sp. IMCC34160 TaxID=2510646 RepID=UPI00101BCB73|nr:hypothetical protein [Loktanella sp. IMCC34160]RYG92652.1 hypothetical protein EU803_00670 [Loktanella sp. IMCC34160]
MIDDEAMFAIPDGANSVGDPSFNTRKDLKSVKSASLFDVSDSSFAEFSRFRSNGGIHDED